MAATVLHRLRAKELSSCGWQLSVSGDGFVEIGHARVVDVGYEARVDVQDNVGARFGLASTYFVPTKTMPDG